MFIGSISKSVSTSRKICKKLLFGGLFLQIVLLADTNFVPKWDRLEILLCVHIGSVSNSVSASRKICKKLLFWSLF